MRKQEWWGVPIPQPGWNVDQSDAYIQLKAQLPLSPALWQRLLHAHGVRVQHHTVWLHLFPPQSSPFPMQDGVLDVLYEDDFCLVVNKPAGILVHPDTANGTRSLANLVTYHYLLTQQYCAIRHIHRLDQDTSGAILYAKNEYAHLFFDEAMRHRQIKRTYTAIVEGNITILQGKISEPIGKDRHHRQKRRVSLHGDEATTYYQVIAHHPQATQLEVQLETGRTHQIRVHMSHIGHPIVGDVLYGASPHAIGRQALHAEQLTFPHPITQAMITVQAAQPEDMRTLWRTIEQS
jgi:23S rRNA pseudouridine1911/1915/1917 synthase